MVKHNYRECTKCTREIPLFVNTAMYKGEVVCVSCFDILIANEAKMDFHEGKQWNEPEHYHKHKIDTIKFLQEGFPPQVFMGFAIGHVIKYAQRAEYKNGREDYVKMVDYAKRALDWYDKNHS